jgi:sec-independent protein translocase protein TatA
MPIGVPELLIVLAIVLLVLGPKRLPALGRSLGGGIRSFKDSITGGGRDDDGHDLAAGTAPVESDTARERRP